MQWLQCLTPNPDYYPYQNIVRHHQNVVMHYQNVVRHHQNVVRHYQNVVRHYQNVVRHYQNVVRHYQNVVRHHQNIVRHPQNVVDKVLTFCILKTPKMVLWQTVKIQMKCSIMLHFIRICTVC